MFRILNPQLHLFNFNEENEINHIYVFVSIIYFTVLFVQPAWQKVDLH